MKYVLVLLLGLVLGGVLVFFLFVGAPRAGALPGAPLKTPDQGGDPAGTAVITLDEKFFDTVLATIFRDMNAPSSLLIQLISWLRRAGQASASDSACGIPGRLHLRGKLLGSGRRNVRPRATFDGKIVAPLAFSGS